MSTAESGSREPREIAIATVGKALAHRLRARILIAALDAGETRTCRASVMAERLHANLSLVSYHMRVLEGLGFLAYVGSVQIRGALANDYRLTTQARTVLQTMDAWHLDDQASEA